MARTKTIKAKLRRPRKEVLSTRVRCDIMDGLRHLRERADSELSYLVNVALEEFLNRELAGWKRLPPPAPPPAPARPAVFD